MKLEMTKLGEHGKCSLKRKTLAKKCILRKVLHDYQIIFPRKEEAFVHKCLIYEILFNNTLNINMHLLRFLTNFVSLHEIFSETDLYKTKPEFGK